ncbi:glucuronate isomerase [Microbacterium sp. A84]|uniref:glucuronate isomerase n=1 Tax=Microbacterium sp. A84 TaxID=3450715 RepID=UPI003F43428E
MNTHWRLHPDRALPAGSTLRPLAREIYTTTAALPIVSMHGHVDASAIHENAAFPDPAALLVTPDHYLVRMLVSQGIEHSSLGVVSADGGAVPPARSVWRTFAENWTLFRGTPTRFWIEHSLAMVFGVTQELSADSADAIFDDLTEKIARPDHRIRALIDRFDIELLSTTDPADSSLEHHRALAEDGWGERVVPTFRPDALFALESPIWRDSVAGLSQRSGVDVGDYAGFLRAIRQRRAAFIEAGARATDHGPRTPLTLELSADEGERIFTAALRGEVTAAEAEAFAAGLLFESGRMSVEDGLVMQVHPGVHRSHSAPIAGRYGGDCGFDIPFAVEYTRSLKPLLDAFGMDPRFRLILFTIDETTYSRELAPLAGAYPSVRLGAPWWFLDSPDGMRRFRELTTETAGFYNTSGFVDDTRAFTSIPGRHDLARRIDAGYLARLVAEHRLSLDEAIETAGDLAYRLPKKSYEMRGV